MRTTHTGYHPFYSSSLVIAAILLLLSSVLLWLCAFSPFINKLGYINLSNGYRLGTFGFCQFDTCSDWNVGYRFPNVPGGKSFTGALILTPIAAGLATFGFLSEFFALRSSRGGFCGIFATVLACFIGILSWIIALACWVTTHRRFSRNAPDSAVDYGAAFWMHLAAAIMLFLAVPLVIVGWLRQRSHARL